ncbi:MAG: hypothetical protein J6Q78_02725 [Clostridia bacterium]|nr:hypothetical protein [Clostridia bacterium]
MDIGFWAVAGKVAKKLLQILAGDEKGRKFLGYVIGIALFIFFLPLIAVLGLFGWMSGETIELSYDEVYSKIPSEYRETIEAYEDELSEIDRVFLDNGLTLTDASKARTIFISCLVGKESEEGFYQRYAECFLNQCGDSDVLTNIENTFSVTFTEQERLQLENLYSS